MSNDLMIPSDIQLPAHLQNLDVDSSMTDSLITTGPSFPRLSLKGSKFHLCKDGEKRHIKLDELRVVIVAATPLGPVPSKVFYKNSYSAGDQEAPDCMSTDGIHPDGNVANPQCATTCAVCPQNAWGSAKTNDGRDAKACKDTKALYIVVPTEDGIEEEVVQVRVPTMSLKHLAKFASLLKSKKLPINSVITKLSFNEESEFPELLFGFGGFLSESQYNTVNEIAAGETITQVLRGEVAIAEVAEQPKEDEIPDAPAHITKSATELNQDVPPPKKEVQSSLFDELGEVEEDDDDDDDELAVEVDCDGRPWDERIDSSNKKKSQKTGRWMRRKNLTDEFYVQIRNELLGKGTEDAAAATPAQFTASTQPSASTAGQGVEDTGGIDDELDALLADLGD